MSQRQVQRLRTQGGYDAMEEPEAVRPGPRMWRDRLGDLGRGMMEVFMLAKVIFRRTWRSTGCNKKHWET